MKYIWICILLIALQTNMVLGQDSAAIYKKRKQIVIAGAGTVYAGSMFLLYQAWYKNYERSSFHFYNDNDNWKYMDKGGHVLTSYQLSRLGHGTAMWAGYSDNQAIWIGGATGFLFQTVIEILDGFSAEWGASPGDIAANTLGSALFITQQKLWQEQRITVKASYHPTKYAQYRPDLLGNNGMERILKDYNGLTIWFSGNLRSLTGHSTIPSWLNIAAGYNAYGMTGASRNSTSYQGLPIPPFERRHRILLAPDIDWMRIETGSGFLKMLFKGLSFIKAPSPAVEYSQDEGIKLRLLFF